MRTLGGHIAGVVHHVARSEATDEVGLLAGAGGRDDPGAGRGGVLHGDRADPTGGAADEHRLARLWGDRGEGVGGGGTGQTERTRRGHVDALGQLGDAE